MGIDPFIFYRVFLYRACSLKIVIALRAGTLKLCNTRRSYAPTPCSSYYHVSRNYRVRNMTALGAVIVMCLSGSLMEYRSGAPWKDTQSKILLIITALAIRVVARSNGWVCGRLLAGIVGSNPATGMDVFFLVSVVRCQVEDNASGRSLVQRSPTECGASVVVKPLKWGSVGPVGAVAP